MTKNEIGGIGTYLKQIGRRKLLTKEQEIELSKLIEGGKTSTWYETVEEDGKKKRVKRTREPTAADKVRAERARKHFIEANLRLVVSIAKGHQNRGCDLEDLIAEGNIGLMKGVERFDWRKGYRFSTYATWWIRQSVGRLVANQGRAIRVPGRAGELQRQLEIARAEYIETNGQEPSRAELADLMGVTEVTVAATLNGIPRLLSLDTPIGSGTDFQRTLEDVIEDIDSDSPFDLVDKGELVQLVSRVLDTLTAREESILRMRFGLKADPKDHSKFPITQHEMKEMMG